MASLLSLSAMSYEKIRKIRITTDKVFITSCSNNVWPQDYEEWEWPCLSNILTKQGREAVDKEILFSYFEGTIWSAVNDRYQRAVTRFEYNLEGDHYELWKKCLQDADFEKAFKQQLYDEFKNPPKKQPCCLERQDGWRLHKITSRRYIYGRGKFKTFPNPIEAAHALRRYGLEEYGFKVVIL